MVAPLHGVARRGRGHLPAAVLVVARRGGGGVAFVLAGLLCGQEGADVFNCEFSRVVSIPVAACQ
ncbi:hypothetical protein UB46_23905 [Burkholderiaceae bacterium 16]|nr:hypothetical protein UB46_23905 [Burkholderiaceae bacterium 16]